MIIQDNHSQLNGDKIDQLEQLIINHYINFDRFDTDNVWESCHDILEDLANTFHGFREEFRNVGNELMAIQHQSEQLVYKIKNRRSVLEKLDKFLEYITISDFMKLDINKGLNDSNRDKYQKSLSDLQKKLYNHSLEDYSAIELEIIGNWLFPALFQLKQRAARDIVSYLEEKFNLLESKKQNNPQPRDIQRTMLLPCYLLYEFVVLHEPTSAFRVRRTYIKIMSNVYIKHFGRYTSALFSIISGSINTLSKQINTTLLAEALDNVQNETVDDIASFQFFRNKLIRPIQAKRSNTKYPLEQIIENLIRVVLSESKAENSFMKIFFYKCDSETFYKVIRPGMEKILFMLQQRYSRWRYNTNGAIISLYMLSSLSSSDELKSDQGMIFEGLLSDISIKTVLFHEKNGFVPMLIWNIIIPLLCESVQCFEKSSNCISKDNVHLLTRLIYRWVSMISESLKHTKSPIMKKEIEKISDSIVHIYLHKLKTIGSELSILSELSKLAHVNVISEQIQHLLNTHINTIIPRELVQTFSSDQLISLIYSTREELHENIRERFTTLSIQKILKDAQNLDNEHLKTSWSIDELLCKLRSHFKDNLLYIAKFSYK